MREVLFRAARVARLPAVALALLLVSLGGSALVALPLFGLPGYELSAALALGLGFLGAAPGIGAARLIKREAGTSQNPRALVLQGAQAAMLLNLAALLLPGVVSLAYAALSTRCSPFSAIAFFPLLPGASALVTAAVGLACGLRARSVGGALLLWALAVVAFAALTLWPILFGPQVFAFNHLAGYLPGPLYDERLLLPASLLWFRLGSLALALACVGLCVGGLDAGTGRLERLPRGRPGAAWLWGSALFLLLEVLGPRLGTRMSDGALAEALGGRKETAHFVLHHPRAMKREALQRTLEDLEFRHRQLEGFFGELPPGKVTVWWYRSAEEKRRLVGAASTQFAKPWRREVHVNDLPFPHPVLKHELVHALAAPWGAEPFGVSMRGPLVNVGIVEGFAVAGDDPLDELSLHGWAAGMQRQQLLPDLRQALTPQGFYAQAPARAYTAAGSFLRWLSQTQGTEKLRALYRRGDFSGVYGAPLDALVGQWEAFLAALPLDAQEINQALARFRRGSLFQRPCAREVAALTEEAGELLSAQPQEALALYQRCSALQPDDPAHALAQVSALERLGRGEEAARALEALAGRLAGDPAAAAEVAMRRAELEWTAGRLPAARALLEQVLTLEVSQAFERTARVKLAALDTPAIEGAVHGWFGEAQDEVKVVRLKDALLRAPGDPTVSYLLGRKLFLAQGYAEAAPYLRDALAGALPKSVRREAWRLALEGAFRGGDCGAVREAAARVEAFSEIFTAQANEWVARCDALELPR